MASMPTAAIKTAPLNDIVDVAGAGGIGVSVGLGLLVAAIAAPYHGYGYPYGYAGPCRDTIRQWRAH